MSTRLTKLLTYDATAEAVTAMLDDQEFREEVLERQRVVRGSATVDGDVVTIEQVRSADDIPSFARSFVGDEILIVQTENWTSPTSADVRLAIPGKPGEAVGTLELVGVRRHDDRDGRPRHQREDPDARRQDREAHRRDHRVGTRRGAEGRPGVARPLARRRSGA